MGLLNDLKNNQNNSDIKKVSAEIEGKTQVIPDDVANDIAAYVFKNMLEIIKNATEHRHLIEHETGLLGKIKKSYYKIGLEWNPNEICINTQRDDLWNDGLFPKDNGYLGSMQHDHSPTEIFASNMGIVKAVFSKVVNRFEKENIKCIFEIREEKYYDIRMDFYVIIPCDKEGNVIG